jgi:hypothetical protein
MELETFLSRYRHINGDHAAACKDIRDYAAKGPEETEQAARIVAYVQSSQFPAFVNPDPLKDTRLFYLRNRLVNPS